MKKIVMAIVCLNTLFAFSQQLSVKKLDGTPINDGDVLVFTSAVEPDNYLGLKFYNNSATEDMYVKANVIGITNATGNNLQFCVLDVCLSSITPGTIFPNFPQVIAPLGTNGNFDHFFNAETGIDPTAPINYVLKIFQVSEDGVEIGNSVTFTYRYDGTLGTEGFDSMANAGIGIKSTMVDNQFEVRTQKNATMEIYDINGKLLGNHKLLSGENSIDASNLSSGMYIANFKNDAGQKTSAKFIKK